MNELCKIMVKMKRTGGGGGFLPLSTHAPQSSHQLLTKIRRRKRLLAV